jgi:hypothetical protein
MRAFAALALLCAFFGSAEARPRVFPACNVTMPCDLSYFAPPAQKRVRVVQHSAPPAPSQIVEHPAGCPRTAFCGCGAAVRIFGAPLKYLWLAANWFKFPRAAPAPHMAAVTRHHVFVLLESRGGLNWLVYDANSGGHLTRVHVRSIAGYTIVNPHSG